MMNSTRALSRALCRIEVDPNLAFQFLQLNGYPYFWSPDDLARGAIVRVIDPEEGTLGYVWGEWLAVGKLSFHVCALSGTRLPFFTSDLLDQLMVMAFWLGANEIETALEGHPNPIPIKRLLLRLGFNEVSDGPSVSYSMNLRSYLNGKQ